MKAKGVVLERAVILHCYSFAVFVQDHEALHTGYTHIIECNQDPRAFKENQMGSGVRG